MSTPPKMDPTIHDEIKNYLTTLRHCNEHNDDTEQALKEAYGRRCMFGYEFEADPADTALRGWFVNERLKTTFEYEDFEYVDSVSTRLRALSAAMMEEPEKELTKADDSVVEPATTKPTEDNGEMSKKSENAGK